MEFSAMADQPIKCGARQVPTQLLIPEDEAEPKRVVCPGLRRPSDDLDVVLASRGEQAEAFAVEEEQKSLVGLAGTDERGMLGVSTRVSAAKPKRRAWKFVIDFKA
ncbi:hypothetical protein [Candidatus Palauibacter sp.]|uniref:hypothetical protein n=1 Tax=Candidatus Palauibacter sp. TaxID=3101350 RepID=UPI003CC55441